MFRTSIRQAQVPLTRIRLTSRYSQAESATIETSRMSMCYEELCLDSINLFALGDSMVANAAHGNDPRIALSVSKLGHDLNDAASRSVN